MAVAGSVFLLAVGFFLVKVGRDALFIQERGLFDLPKAYLGIAALAGPLAAVVLTMMRSVGPRTSRLILSAGASLALLVFSIYIRPGGGYLMTAFFIFVPLVWGVLYSMSWLLAGDLLDGIAPQRLARSYGLIGGGAIFGGLVGGVLAKSLAHYLPPRQILWLAAAAVGASGLVLGWAQRRWPPHMTPPPTETQPTLLRGMADVMGHRLGRMLLVVGMAGGLVSVLLEFQFYLVAAGGSRIPGDSADFFANIYIILNGAALALQVLVLPRLHRWIGVGGGLLVLPIVLVGGAGALVASASLLGVASLRVAEGGLKSSLHRPNWEQAYLFLPATKRAMAKFVVDGFGVRIAEGLAAGLMALWLARFATVAEAVAGGTEWTLGTLFAFSLAWLFLAGVLRRGIGERLADEPAVKLVQYGVPLPDG